MSDNILSIEKKLEALTKDPILDKAREDIEQFILLQSLEKIQQTAASSAVKVKHNQLNYSMLKDTEGDLYVIYRAPYASYFRMMRGSKGQTPANYKLAYNVASEELCAVKITEKKPKAEEIESLTRLGYFFGEQTRNKTEKSKEIKKHYIFQKLAKGISLVHFSVFLKHHQYWLSTEMQAKLLNAIIHASHQLALAGLRHKELNNSNFLIQIVEGEWTVNIPDFEKTHTRTGYPSQNIRNAIDAINFHIKDPDLRNLIDAFAGNKITPESTETMLNDLKNWYVSSPQPSKRRTV